MVTPRRTAQRASLEPSEDTTKTKVVIPKGTKALVTEQIGAKTVSYESEVEEDETQTQTEDTEFENLDSIDEGADYPQIPKSSLDNMFEDVSYSVANDNMYDTFFAKLVRTPDAINDKFNSICRDQIEIGVIQFSSLDRFNFIPAIQEANGNSGGRFSISIYNSEYKPFETMRNMTFRPRPVGLILVVPNPNVKALTETTSGNPVNGFEQVFNKMIEIQQQNHNQLRELLTRKPEKSTLELAIEQKVLNDILNPPQQNNNNGTDVVANVMQSAAVITSLSDAFARNLNREPAPEPEKDWMDKINKVAEMPLAQQLAGRIMDIGDAIAVNRLNLTPPQENTETAENPNQTTMPTTATQELITDIIDELDGENPLDVNNETIKELAAEYPDQFADLVVMCQTAEFNTVFALLLNKTAKMNPFPFEQFLDVAATQASTATNLIEKCQWNDNGKKLIERLKELHAFLKTVI